MWRQGVRRRYMNRPMIFFKSVYQKNIKGPPLEIRLLQYFGFMLLTRSVVPVYKICLIFQGNFHPLLPLKINTIKPQVK